MPSKDPALWLRDILDGIGSIERFTARMDFAAFLADEKTAAAVERKLLQISEAAVRLGDEAPRLCPGIPWNEVRGIGNWLRHQYDRVDARIVWDTVERGLPPLKAAVQKALLPPPAPSPTP